MLKSCLTTLKVCSQFSVFYLLFSVIQLFVYILGGENSVVSKPHRTVTVMRLNMIFTLLKGAFQQLNATVFEETVFNQSNYVKSYKNILLKSIENNIQTIKSAGGFLPYAINHENLEGNSSQQGAVNVAPKKFCVVCRLEDTEEKVLDHQAKFHFIDRFVYIFCCLFYIFQ